jgi:hypothetical protein
MKPDISFVTKSGHFYLLTTLTSRRQFNRNSKYRSTFGLEIRFGLVSPVEIWKGTFLAGHTLPRLWLRDFGRGRLSAPLYRNYFASPSSHLDATTISAQMHGRRERLPAMPLAVRER